jgi:hypothetical protein
METKIETKRYPSIEELQKTVDDFNKNVDSVIVGDKIPQSKRLELYKDGITKLRERGFSYEKIATIIKETTKKAGCEFNVNAPAIRRYCQTIGFDKKFTRNAKTDPVGEK